MLGQRAIRLLVNTRIVATMVRKMNSDVVILVVLGLKFIPFWVMLDMITYCFANKHTDVVSAMVFYVGFVLYTMKVGLKADED